jgi:hypothetical protein
MMATKLVDIIRAGRVRHDDVLRPVPPPRVVQRILPTTVVAHPDFPRAVRRAYRAAVAVPGARVALTYSVGPWMRRDFTRVLDHDVPTLTLWVVAPPRRRLRALWLRRHGRWALESAWAFPPPTHLDSEEMHRWLADA